MNDTGKEKISDGKVTLSFLLSNPVHFIAFGFGSGLTPIAPGTAGTVVAALIYLLVQDLPIAWYCIFFVAAFGAGVLLCQVTARNIGVHDHPGIVWDEIVGYLITMTAAPKGWLWILGGFILFRLFDIWKPWPIRKLDQSVGGGLGIMLDDIVAGVYAWVVLQACVIWLVR